MCFLDLIFLNQDFEILLGDGIKLPLSTEAIFFSAVTSRNKCETHFPQRWLLTYFFHFTKAARIVDGQRAGVRGPLARGPYHKGPFLKDLWPKDLQNQRTFGQKDLCIKGPFPKGPFGKRTFWQKDLLSKGPFGTNSAK